LRALVLFGEHELTIDDKNRLLIPSQIRKAIHPEDHGEALFLIVGKNKVLWAYPDRYYQEVIANQASNDVVPEDNSLDFDQLNYALADKLEWDKQGRVVIPERMLRRTQLGKEITLIGARNHIELWNRADWEARREELDARRSEIAVRVRNKPGQN
jgi:MraZ protein